VAKSEKSPEGSSKKSKNTVTMRQHIENERAKSAKGSSKNIVTTPSKKATAKDVTKKQREAELNQRSFLGAFFWGFTLPIRLIWKPISWLLRHIIPPYFKNSWKEIKQVTWPSFKDTTKLTFIVLLFAMIFGGVIAAVDYGLDKVFKALILG
jgi:preprotein translocase SecE subunit